MDSQGGIRKHWCSLLLLAAFVAAVIIALLHHEPWRDEADAWLAARDLSLSELRNFCRHSGSPPLWHVLQMPFAKAGLPFAAQGWLNAAFAFCAAALFIRHAPFRPLFKALFLFNYFFAYEYAVIARSYMLGGLLLFVLASLYRQRTAYLIAYGLAAAGLALTNIHGALMAIVILAELAFAGRRDLRRTWPGLTMGAAGVFLSIIYVWPPADGQILRPQPMAWTLDEVFANAFVPTRRLENASLAAIGHVLSAASLIAVAILLARRPRLLFAYVATVVLFYALFAFGHFGDIRHSGLLQLCAIFYLWLAGVEDANAPPDGIRRTAWVILAAALTVSCWGTWRIYKLDRRLAYSAAPEMATFIRSRIGQHRWVAAFPDPPAESVLAHLPPRTFWYAGSQRDGSYLKWDRRHALNRRIPVAKAMERIEAYPGHADLFLVLLNSPMPQKYSQGYQLLYATTSVVFSATDEQYWLYQSK